MGIRFEWDEAKNIANQSKHGLSFEQARQAFLDPLHFSVKERIEHGEERWQTFGRVDGLILLMVVHTIDERSDDATSEIVRIISARRATRKERRRYEDEDRSI